MGQFEDDLTRHRFFRGRMFDTSGPTLLGRTLLKTISILLPGRNQDAGVRTELVAVALGQLDRYRSLCRKGMAHRVDIDVVLENV
jgi:hypothetical protein